MALIKWFNVVNWYKTNGTRKFFNWLEEETQKFTILKGDLDIMQSLAALIFPTQRNKAPCRPVGLGILPACIQF